MTAESRKVMVLAWSGPVGIALVLIGWMVLAGFLPPPSPSLSDQQITELWHDHTALKRLGMTICVWGGVLYVPFTVAIMLVLRRGEAGEAIWSRAQAAMGTFGTVFFSLNFLLLAMVPFRPSAISHTLHDVGFAMTFAPVAPFTIQYLLIAAVVLQDTSARPVFPRWVGYVNVWVALGLVPACLIPFFDHGPLAWNGVFSFWIPVAVFVAWYGVMFWAVRRAVRSDRIERPDEPATIDLVERHPNGGSGVDRHVLTDDRGLVHENDDAGA